MDLCQRSACVHGGGGGGGKREDEDKRNSTQCENSKRITDKNMVTECSWVHII